MALTQRIRVRMVYAAAFAAMGICVAMRARGAPVLNADPDTLWVETFDPFEESADSRGGWYAFEPEEISVEQVGDRVRFREVSAYAGGSIQRIFPLGGREYRYLQVRVTEIEDAAHFFKAWLRMSGHGNPQLGRLPVGITTIDLSVFPFFGRVDELPLDLAVIGPTGSLPSGFVEVDWVRLASSPAGGLTMALVEEGEPDGVARIGDAVVFTYTYASGENGPVEVECRLAKEGEAFRFDPRERFLLTDDGENGDAEAGDGVATCRVEITPDAPETSAGPGAVIATANVRGEPRNTSALFGLEILPASWQAARAAERVVRGEVVFGEDFSGADVSNWRAYGEGWHVYRPEAAGEANGLRNMTYDRPLVEGHWIALPHAAAADARLSAAVRPLGGAGTLMLALRFQDPENHYRFVLDGRDTVAIERVVAGWQERLAETRLSDRLQGGLGSPASVATFTVAGPLLLATIDGRPVLHAYDPRFTEGRAALGLNRLNGQFEDVALERVELREAPEEFPWSGVRLEVALRPHDTAFGRDRGDVRIPLVVENGGTLDLGETEIDLAMIWRSLVDYPVAQLVVDSVPAGSSVKANAILESSRFRSGDYWLVARLRDGRRTIATDAVRIVIGSPVPPERMDVFWWGGANLAGQIEAVADAGVTVMHEQARRSPALWALGQRLGLVYYSYPPGFKKAPAAVRSAFENPKASSHALRVDELDPAFRSWALDTARAHARVWKSNPRLRYVLLNTEFEFHEYPNLSAAAEKRYQGKLGFPRPPEADVPYVRFSPATSLAAFPDRIVPDESPLYRWFRFFYVEGGGGLNGITNAQAEAIAEIAPQITTFHDPVLRAPQFHGRWDGLGLLNHWTYVEQNPLAAAAFADELVCLGRRSGWRQQISQMIQVIAYSNRAMPENRQQAPEYLRDASFVAIPPDILSEAAWLALSRPIDMIAFHGLQTAIETQEKENYRYTNPQTMAALRRVSRELIEPYGPALRCIKTQAGPRVALLLSAANTVFGRITEGGGSQALHTPLTAGRFQVDVLYDGDVQDGALQDYAALAIPQCRFLLRSVRERIDAFQGRGGTVLLDGDARIELPGAIRLPSAGADIEGGRKLELVPGEVLDLPDSNRAVLDAELRRTAEALRELLLPRLGTPPLVDSPHPYVVLNARRSGDLTYVFAVNDRRTVGPYLGPYGAVLEQGVPIDAELHFAERPAALYDALNRRQLEPVPAADGAGSSVRLAIEGGSGRLLVACPERLAPPDVSVATHAAPARSLTVSVQVLYASGRPVDAVVPIRVDVRDAAGALNDYSRFTATDDDGRWTLTFPLADNDPPGSWTVRVTELIGGHTSVAHVEVTTLKETNRN